jgi:predicted Fe-Mo cluster-binding NifX family protein
MKLCIPTNGEKGLDEQVHNHFGSASFFTLFDTESDEIQTINNSNEQHEHGACQPLSVISDYHVQAILTGGMGRRAVQMLNDGGVKVFLMEGNTVREAVENYRKNRLTELTAENACGGHGHDHGSEGQEHAGGCCH